MLWRLQHYRTGRQWTAKADLGMESVRNNMDCLYLVLVKIIIIITTLTLNCSF